MTYRMLIFVLAVVALIAFPAANAIADESKDDHVVIVKCREINAVPPTAPTGPTVFLFQASAGFPELNLTTCQPGLDTCADCLKSLISDPLLDCEGDDEFTSNVVVEQPSIAGGTGDQLASIDKFVFACGAPPPPTP